MKTRLEDNSEEKLQQMDSKSLTGIGFGRKKDEGKVLENINTKFYVVTEVFLALFYEINKGFRCFNILLSTVLAACQFHTLYLNYLQELRSSINVLDHGTYF